MKTSEIIALIGLCFSGILFVISCVVFYKNTVKEKKEEYGKSARVDVKLDYIKVQTELINVEIKEISSKLDSQNSRIVALEQTVENVKINEMPDKLARLDVSLSEATKKINDIEREINKIKSQIIYKNSL